MQNHTDTALLILGHGSTENPDSSLPTLEHARELRQKGEFAEVHTAFWKEEPGFRDVLYGVDAPRVYLVPNFISEGYFTQTIIPREMGLDGPVTHRGGQTLYYCEPVGCHPAMTRLLRKRAEDVAPDVDPGQTSLLIVGHGTGLNDLSAEASRKQAAKLATETGYAEVLAVFMEEAPLVAEWDTITKSPNVVVVPFFISDGLHSYQDIPVLLGIESEPTIEASRREVFRHNPHHLRGKTLYYASSIGTEPGFAEVILDQVKAFDSAHGESGVK